MRSMTGYGEGVAQCEQTGLHVQVKTLNHRFFQMQLACSEDVPWDIEKQIEKAVKRRIHRGKVVVTVQLVDSPADAVRIEPDLEKARAYHQRLQALAEHLGLEGQVGLAHILNMPGILRERERPWAKLAPAVLEALKEAMSHVSKTRKTEGDKHRREVLGHLEEIQAAARYIEESFPVEQQKYRDKLQDEFEKLNSSEELGAGSNQISPKLALMVTKGDITEEVVRFNAHLEQLRVTIKDRGGIGKKLGFLLQELQREINTIGAKSLSSEISSRAVQIKDNIEKIREQIYNIE